MTLLHMEASFDLNVGWFGRISTEVILTALLTLVFVGLYGPVLDLSNFFCSVVGFATGPGHLSYVSLGECIIQAPYVVAGRTMTVHTSLALLKMVAQVEASTLFKAIV